MDQQALVPEVENKVSTEVAETFVSSFYPSLSSPAKRNSLPAFYVSANFGTVDITLNGQVMPTQSAAQTFYTSMPPANFEVQSYDAHCVNPNYNVGAPDSILGFDKTGKKISVLVVVSGFVKFFEGADKGKSRGFTESFILVPNFGLRKASEGQKWVIQSQNFRMVL